MYERIMKVALPQIRCQLHDHAKQYDKSNVCHDDDERNGGKLHGIISQNGYGNAIIGRYGGCFEEGIWVFRTLVCYFYIANEGISLLENAGNLGLPVPEKLKAALAQLKDKESEDEE